MYTVEIHASQKREDEYVLLFEKRMANPYNLEMWLSIPYSCRVFNARISEIFDLIRLIFTL